mmetsp:Transcript_10389/g.24744  ORF Transcript_10389/g.24744 Transcript_10389/m.24744 type:complete len:228 (-) Transcript_10389:88-771(-)
MVEFHIACIACTDGASPAVPVTAPLCWPPPRGALLICEATSSPISSMTCARTSSSSSAHSASRPSKTSSTISCCMLISVLCFSKSCMVCCILAGSNALFTAPIALVAPAMDCAALVVAPAARTCEATPDMVVLALDILACCSRRLMSCLARGRAAASPPGFLAVSLMRAHSFASSRFRCWISRSNPRWSLVMLLAASFATFFFDDDCDCCCAMAAPGKPNSASIDNR